MNKYVLHNKWTILSYRYELFNISEVSVCVCLCTHVFICECRCARAIACVQRTAFKLVLARLPHLMQFLALDSYSVLFGAHCKLLGISPVTASHLAIIVLQLQEPTHSFQIFI